MNIVEHKYSFAKSLSKRKSTKKIVVHHAASKSCSVTDIHRWHLANGWSGIGYHFFVRKDGSVHECRPVETVGAHTYGENADSIGICFEGNFETEKMSAAQKEAGAKLITYIKGLYPSIETVGKHKDYCSTACPGRNFPFDYIAKGASETEEDKASYEPTVKEWQRAAIADGFSFPKYGADGIWGNECAGVARVALVMKKDVYTLKNLTRIVQAVVGTDVDGLCGVKTDAAIREYQKKHGLTVDGIVGINTWKKILGV